LGGGRDQTRTKPERDIRPKRILPANPRSPSLGRKDIGKKRTNKDDEKEEGVGLGGYFQSDEPKITIEVISGRNFAGRWEGRGGSHQTKRLKENGRLRDQAGAGVDEKKREKSKTDKV